MDPGFHGFFGNSTNFEELVLGAQEELGPRTKCVGKLKARSFQHAKRETLKKRVEKVVAAQRGTQNRK